LQAGGVNVEQAGEIFVVCCASCSAKPLQYRHVFRNIGPLPAGSLCRDAGPAPGTASRFHQQAIERNIARGIAQLLGITERDDPENEI
jgi:hypothetical protein